jgi:hypothetical protein
MERTTQEQSQVRSDEPRDRPEPQETWNNTTPRENQELDRGDLERSIDRLEAVLGR